MPEDAHPGELGNEFLEELQTFPEEIGGIEAQAREIAARSIQIDDETGLAGYSPRAGGAVCENCAAGALPLSGQGLRGIEGLLRRPLAEANEAGLTERGAREALGVITGSYEYHGGFRLRTLAS